MSRTIELRWNCGECGTEDILGRFKTCPSCGSPREKGEMKMGGLERTDFDPVSGKNKAPSVSDPELLKLSGAGADWFCSNCESGNIGTGDRCSACGSLRVEDEKTDPSSNEREESPPVEHLESDIPQDHVTPKKKMWLELHKMKFLALSVAGLVVGLLWFLIWAMQTHEISGTVVGMEWSRTVMSEQWTQTRFRRWRHQTTELSEIPPKNGSGERAGLLLIPSSCLLEHFEDEKYVCGHHEECHDVFRSKQESYPCTRSESYVCGETCSDNGNGFASCSDKHCTRSVPDTCSRSVQVFDHKECHTVDDYCTRPINKDRCDYRTQEWKPSGTFPTSGSGKNMIWGNEPEGDEVRRFYSVTHEVIVSYTDGGEPNSYEIISSIFRTSRSSAEEAAASYLSWDIGDPVKLEINNLGGVHSAVHE